MKYFLIILCLQFYLTGVLSVFSNAGNAKERNPTNSTLRPAELACGVYSNMPVSRILDGDLVKTGEFPWMAALMYLDQHESRIHFGCGGTIISLDFVLTAAHCVKSSRPPIFVRLGKITLSDEEYHHYGDVRAVNYQVKEIIRHPNYSALAKKNNIALIRLTKSISFTNNIAPACLNIDMGDLGDLIVTGWGVTDPDRNSMSNELFKAQLKTKPLLECNSTYLEWNREPNLPFFRNGLDEGQYCAYDPEGKKDSCQGDSGGPLQYFPANKSTATVVGIVSFGINCATSLPSVYTRVAFYIDWIEPIVWPTHQ